MVAGRLALLARGKSKTLYWSLLKIASKITIFLGKKWKFMSFEGEMNAEFNDVDSKVFWRHRNVFSPWGWPAIYTTCEFVSRCLRTLHTKWQTHIPALSVHSAYSQMGIYQIWIKGLAWNLASHTIIFNKKLRILITHRILIITNKNTHCT